MAVVAVGAAVGAADVVGAAPKRGLVVDVAVTGAVVAGVALKKDLPWGAVVVVAPNPPNGGFSVPEDGVGFADG